MAPIFNRVLLCESRAKQIIIYLLVPWHAAGIVVVVVLCEIDAMGPVMASELWVINLHAGCLKKEKHGWLCNFSVFTFLSLPINQSAPAPDMCCLLFSLELLDRSLILPSLPFRLFNGSVYLN